MYEVYLVLNDGTTELGYGSDIPSIVADVNSIYAESDIAHISFTKTCSTAMRQGRVNLGCTARKRAEGNKYGSKAVPPMR